MSARVVLRVGLGILLGLTFAWLAFGRVEWGGAARHLESLDGQTLAAALMLLGLGYGARIWRWWMLLRPLAPTLPFSATVGPFLAGMALNNVLPLRAGDLARTVTFRTELGLPPSLLFGTLLVERLADLLTLLLFLLLGVLLGAGGGLSGTILLWGGAGAVLLAMAVGLGGRIALRAADGDRGGPSAAGRAEGRPEWRSRLAAVLLRVCQALALVRSPGVAARLAASSLVAWLFEGAMFATVAAGLGMEAGLGPWFALTTGTLGTLVPGMPGHVGTFDYFAMQGSLAFGASEPAAALFALSVHLLLWVPITAIGLSALLILKARPAVSGRIAVPTSHD